MKKITILALHLGYGGIEKCITSLANSLSIDYQVEIISTYKLYDTPPFNINDNINVSYLIEDLKPNKEQFTSELKKLHFISACKEGIKSIKILYLRKKLMIKAIKNCDSDVIISTRDIHNEWLGKYGNKKCLKIGWEHNHHNNNKKYIDKVVKSVKNLNYFVLVSKELEEFYHDKLKGTKCKTVYIPNTLDYTPKKLSNLDRTNIVSIGRLSKEKGFLDLISVFNLVHKKYPDWQFHIIGDGSEKSKIEHKIKEYKLENFIHLHGFQKKDYINQVLQNSSIYVMGSYTESFGIVLLESFSFGIPCIAFDSAQGAREIISNNWDGYLVENRDKNIMAKRICELIANPNRRIIMGANGVKKIEQYSIEKVREKWIQIMK
jgi:glycosyltransferase involved in cell wall biosynthesis